MCCCCSSPELDVDGFPLHQPRPKRQTPSGAANHSQPTTAPLVDGKEHLVAAGRPSSPSISRYIPDGYDKYEVPTNFEGGEQPPFLGL